MSVVITAYNALPFLPATLDSVLAQTYRDVEVIVVDDGSTDETAAAVARYGRAVRYVYQENRGQPAARNAGIRVARGAFVAFVDADDLWLPDKLARQMETLEHAPGAAWAYADAYVFDSDTGHTLYRASQQHVLHEGDILRPLLLGNFIPSPTPVVRRAVFEEVGFFDERPAVRNGEDWNMWLRIAAMYPVRLVRAPLAKNRLHRRSMLQTMDLDYALQSRLTILKEAAARTADRTADLHGRACARVYTTFGRYAMSRGERRRALELFARALRRAPRHVPAWTFLLATLLPPPLRRVLGRLRSWRRQQYARS